ncbi:MAG: nuclear transport factor 2 family protein [Bacteroidales bacterium]
MKKSGICIVVFSVLMIMSCRNTIDIEAEKQTIIDVINAETEAYMNFDFDKVAEFYIHDSLNFRLTTGSDDHIFLEGWDEVENFFREELIEGNPNTPSDTHIKVAKDNYRIRVYERSAFVLCDEMWTYTTDEKVIEIESRQVRFMEKLDGEWKIAFLSFIGTSGYEAEEELEGLGLEYNSVN